MDNRTESVASPRRVRRVPDARRGVGLLFAVGVVIMAALVVDPPTAMGSRVLSSPLPSIQGCTVQWSPPETLKTANGHLVMVDAPEIAPWRDGWAMVGRLALETNTLGRLIRIPNAPGEYLRAGFLLRDDEIVEPIPAPDVEELTSPRVASVSADRAVLVWGRSAGMETLSDEVWSAEYDGTSWSDVQRVMAGVELAWSPTYHSRLVVAGTELRLLAGDRRAGADSGAVLLRWSRGRWTTVPLRMPSTSYIQLADLPGDTMVVAYVGRAAPHGNTLFAQRFDLSGNAVGERVRVSLPEAGVVYDVRIVATRDSVLYIVWPGWPSPSAAGTPEQSLQRMFIARSDDQGRSWTVNEGPLVDLRQPSALTAMVDARGAVHVSTRIQQGSVSWPGHLTWRSGSWHVSQPPRVPEGLLVGAPVVVPLTNDSLRMIWHADRLSDRAVGVVTTPGMMLSSRGAMTCAGG